MNAPDKIYIPYETDSNYISKHYYLGPTPKTDKMENAEYIRKGLVDEMVKSAEDHAYFAGQEKMREKLLEWIDKMCEENKGFSEAELFVTLDKLKEKIKSL